MTGSLPPPVASLTTFSFLRSAPTGTGGRHVITGSDSGIGQATAEAFAKEGADVAITYLPVEAAGRRAIVMQLDQRDPAQVARLFEETEGRLGAPPQKADHHDHDDLDEGDQAVGRHRF